jgi:hypothetical protein
MDDADGVLELMSKPSKRAPCGSAAVGALAAADRCRMTLEDETAFKVPAWPQAVANLSSLRAASQFWFIIQ